jgi:FMN-dependent NADH-azoreductase
MTILSIDCSPITLIVNTGMVPGPIKETAMKLLHLDSSALGTHSVTRELSAAVVASVTRAHPGTEVSYRDLVKDPLPHWTPVSDAADPAVRSGSEAMDQFLESDVIVVGAPMYNFSIPSQLKAWIDRIAVAGKTFRYGPNGPEGLAKGKKVVIASARGGAYGENSPYDFQESYLRHLFGFLGVTDIEFVRAEGVANAERKPRAIAEAHARIGQALPLAA